MATWQAPPPSGREGSEKNGPPLQEHNPQKQGHQGAGFGHRLLSGMVCPAQQKARRGRRPARARLPTSERLLAPTLELGRERTSKQVPKRGARARASAARCCGVWCPPRSSRHGKGAGVRAPRRLPLRVCLPASEIWRTEDKADRLKQGACARALLPHASVGNGTHRTAAGASLRSACARPALALSPLSAVRCGIFLVLRAPLSHSPLHESHDKK